jgi:TolB protein
LALRVIAAVGIALFALSLSAANASSGKNGRLLLLTCDPTADSQRSSHFRTMRADGVDFRTIAKFDSTSNYCYVDRATWSPDGRTIVYSTGNSIWTMRADGTRRRKLLEEGGYAAWSPNGREIVFTNSVGPGRAAVFRVRRDGSGVRQVTPAIESEVYAPSWSPNGQTIAFTRYLKGVESIWTVGADGSRLRELAEGGRWPDWSPDGRRIIFTDQLSVWTMAPGGDRRRRLTPPVLEEEVSQATFSPDARRVAFVRGFRVWVMTAGGRRAHPVSPVDSSVGEVDWRRG